MTTRKMVMATDKVEYLVKEMNADHIKVVSEYEPGWTVIEITIDTAIDVLDIFYAGMRCGHNRAQKESYI
jgi:hypothetical protein